MRQIRLVLLLSIAFLVTCSPKIRAETITLRYTVPIAGADSVTCIITAPSTPVRAVSLWYMRGSSPAANDSLITKRIGLMTPGAQDSFTVGAPSPRTLRLYLRAENTAGRGCPSNIITVIFDGVPPAKINDFGL